MAQHPDIVNWRDIAKTDGRSDPGSDALMSESTEDAFVHVLQGTPDVWLDGHLQRLAPGDYSGLPSI